MRRIFLISFGLLSLAVVAIFVTLFFTSGASGENPSDCRAGDVLDGVHDPERLKVIDPCMTARGTVAIVQDDPDGDWHIGLIPDPADLDLLGSGNVTKVGGLLVVEVIPKDQPTVNRPRIGSRIEVTGVYVIDAPNGWREIHPAWDIREIFPSPIPQGVGQRTRNIASSLKRMMVRLRAELIERFY